MSAPDEVVVLDLGVTPEAAISGGLLIQSEEEAFLIFNAMRAAPDGKRTKAGTAVIALSGLHVCKMGMPNDEALGGHPILGRADLGYVIVEVLRSSWIAEAERRNRVAFPGSSLAGRRHFAVSMHESTFECIARDIVLTLHDDPYPDVARAVLARTVGAITF